MRLFLPIVLGLLAIVIVLIAVAWVRGRRRRQGDDAVARVLARHGAGRCSETARLLRRLDPADLPTVWPRIEEAVAATLPDCAPDVKPELLAALDTAAATCPHRDTSRALMAARNRLLAGE
jgi:hypothetical protein